jgi:hypothetical protein
LRSTYASSSLAVLLATGCGVLPSAKPSNLKLLAQAAEACREAIGSIPSTQAFEPAVAERACEPVWAVRDRVPDGSSFPPAYALLVNAYSRVAVLSSEPADARAALERAIRIADDVQSSLPARSELKADLARTYGESPELYESLGQEALALAERSGDSFTIARRHRDLGEMYEYRSDFDRAEVSYLREIATYEELRRKAQSGEPLPDNARIRGTRAEAEQLQRELVLRNVGWMLPGARRKLENLQKCRPYYAAFPRQQAIMCCHGFFPNASECRLPEERH